MIELRGTSLREKNVLRLPGVLYPVCPLVAQMSDRQHSGYFQSPIEGKFERRLGFEKFVQADGFCYQ